MTKTNNANLMRAVFWTAYGPPEVLKVTKLEKPTPKANEVLIKIKTATVTAGDCEVRRFQIVTWLWIPIRLIFGIFKPRIKTIGQEMSGVIEAVGQEVTKFKPGDEIFASTGIKMGAYAEYVCLSEKHPMSIKPENVAFEESATLPTGGINGLHFLRHSRVKKGDQILINGAGGSIGTYATQIAKLYGAEVTVVDSGEKLKMLETLGADHLIDYRKEDFTKSRKAYDVIIDIVGKSSYSRCLKCLKPNGRYLLGNPSFTGMMRGFWTSWTTDKEVLFKLAAENNEDYDYLKSLLAEKKIKVVIDNRYPLEEIVKAHHYVDQGHKQGNLIVEIS